MIEVSAAYNYALERDSREDDARGTGRRRLTIREEHIAICKNAGVLRVSVQLFLHVGPSTCTCRVPSVGVVCV